MSACVIDVFEFCRRKERIGGELRIADLVRLVDELADDVGQAGVLQWSLAGGVDQFGHPQLRLAINGQIKLVCQRCLGAMPFQIASESALILAKDEDEADAIDALINDEKIDVIVGNVAFDVVYLLEDEALLALPTAPKHTLCPVQVVEGASAAVTKISPFSILKNLK